MNTKQTGPASQDNLMAFVQKASSICILTHDEVDPDAVCSQLLMSHILHTYSKKKSISLFVQENDWPQFHRLKLPGIEKVTNVPGPETLPLGEYDLVILLDCNGLSRTINVDTTEDLSNKLVIIDHHPMEAEDDYLLHINEQLSSTVELLYMLFLHSYPKIREDKIVSKLAQIGILADTGRFLHGNISPETFHTFGDMYRTNPLNLEEIAADIRTYSRVSFSLFNTIVENLVFDVPMAYSFIPRNSTVSGKITFLDIDSAKSIFINSFLRSIEGVDWGFLVYYIPDNDNWKVSFRARTGTVPVVDIAKALGGGGHTYAAGADIDADTPEEAVAVVLRTIAQLPTLA
jgi:bifunctional oligoribonuclease and PAP phosphatase NrnA